MFYCREPGYTEDDKTKFGLYIALIIILAITAAAAGIWGVLVTKKRFVFCYSIQQILVTSSLLLTADITSHCISQFIKYSELSFEYIERAAQAACEVAYMNSVKSTTHGTAFNALKYQKN